MKLQKAIVIGMALGAAAYAIGSAVAYVLQDAPLIGRPAYLCLELLNFPSLYVGINYFPHFFFNSSYASIFFYTVAVNLLLAALGGGVAGLAVSRLARQR